MTCHDMLLRLILHYHTVMLGSVIPKITDFYKYIDNWLTASKMHVNVDKTVKILFSLKNEENYLRLRIARNFWVFTFIHY